MTLKFLHLTITALVLNVASFAQTADTLARIDALFSHWNNATPGGSVAIQRGDKIIYHKAFGLSDLEHNVPNTTETIFESGSVAKQFTATALLMLAADGKLNLQDDVRKYVPELPVYDAPITILHLLNHTSGLKDWGVIGGLAGWPRTSRIYTQDLALQIICKQKTLNFTPGFKYSYSNSNYTLLVTIAERLSKKTLAQFTDSLFFRPLQMNHTQWRDNFRDVIPNRAIAYSGSENNYRQLMPFEHIHGHGGLLTTTGDLLKWNNLLENNSLIGNQVAHWRVQRGIVNSGAEIQYAAGLNVTKTNGFKEISHSGATAGYKAWLAYYPEKKLSVAILSNDANFRGIPDQIAELFLGKEPLLAREPTTFIDLSEDEKKSWSGVYKSAEDFDVIQLDYKDQKILSNGNAIKALHRDTLYFDKFYWIKSSLNEIILKTQNQTRKYARVTPPDLRIQLLQQLSGKYFSEEAEATYLVSLNKDQLTVRVLPWPSQKLVPAHLNGFRDEDDTYYEFKKDKKGKITGLEVSTGRALRVPFLKIN
jgi:CubicO group peptidase (beta-lactamase class C family)